MFGFSGKRASADAEAGVDDQDVLTILERLEHIERRIDRLTPTGVRRDEVVAGIAFDRLVQPFAEDVIAFYDRLQHVLAPFRAGGPLPAEMRESLLSLDEEILEILQRQGIEPFSVNVLNPDVHHVVKREPTRDQALDKRVARRHRCGFRHGKVLLRREEVDVYRYEG